MADDHAPHALGCCGSAINQTPNLDRLAREGMRFTRAFDTVSLCAPSRAVLLTGKYSHVNGFTNNECAPFDGSQPTFPKLLQTAGYQTALVGKWHLESQPTGFDYYNIMNGHGQYWDCPFKESTQPWEANDRGFTPRPGYLTDTITDISLEWLDGKRDTSKPFCLMIHHKAPHAPHEYPAHYERLYTGTIPLPETFEDDWAGRSALKDSPCRWSKLVNMIDGDLHGNELGQREIPPRNNPAAFRLWAYQTFMKGYLRLIAALDDNVGRVLDYLKRTGLAGNTVVVYTSDNGFFLGDHGLYNKMWMYEPSLSLPLIIRHPGHIVPETTCDAMVSLIDLAPTFLELAGAPISSDIQGHSLVNLLGGKTQNSPRSAHYYHYYRQYDVPSICGLRTETHKIICYHELVGDARWELFDLKSDPQELHNLALVPQHAELLFRMQQQLRKAAESYRDPVYSEL